MLMKILTETKKEFIRKLLQYKLKFHKLDQRLHQQHRRELYKPHLLQVLQQQHQLTVFVIVAQSLIMSGSGYS